MMKFCVILILSLVIKNSVKGNIIDLNYIRENYYKAFNDKKLCIQMLKDLKSLENESVYLAYLGAFQTICANHFFNPISKLNIFNKGKKNIELAVDKNPNNIEIRFIRLSVQKNSPSFLNYKININEDKMFLKKKKTKSIHLYC